MKKTQRSIRHLVEASFLFILSLIQSTGIFLFNYPEEAIAAVILALNLLTASFIFWLVLSKTNKKQLITFGILISGLQVASLSFYLVTYAYYYISSTPLGATFLALNGFSLLAWFDLMNYFRKIYSSK
jgi:hypothetical protein